MRRIAALVVLFAIAGLAWGACDANAAKEEIKTNDVPIATLLYVGFGFDKHTYEPVGGLGTRGWNVIQGDSLYEGFVATQPEIGWYASKKMETIAWQLAQMQRAGIEVIFLSWQGWGDDNLDGAVDAGSIAVEYDATAKLVLDYIKENKLPFRFGILVEDFPGNFQNLSLLDLTTQQRQMVMDHLWENYYSPETYGELAFQWNGKPLIAGGAWTPGDWWEIHDFTDPRFELREIYDKPEAENEHWTAAYYTPPPSKLPGPEGVVMIWPRHDALLPVLAQNAPWIPSGTSPDTIDRVDPFGTEGDYDEAWREVIEHDPRSDIRLIWIWIWNSYAEMTYIEPDWGLEPYGVGDLYVRKTAHYANLFRSGRTFEHFNE